MVATRGAPYACGCLSLQVYEPEWLAGTSVGDVMFQADYFLKELALGEYTMPALGSGPESFRVGEALEWLVSFWCPISLWINPERGLPYHQLTRNLTGGRFDPPVRFHFRWWEGTTKKGALI